MLLYITRSMCMAICIQGIYVLLSFVNNKYSKINTLQRRQSDNRDGVKRL